MIVLLIAGAEIVEVGSVLGRRLGMAGVARLQILLFHVLHLAVGSSRAKKESRNHDRRGNRQFQYAHCVLLGVEKIPRCLESMTGIITPVQENTTAPELNSRNLAHL